MAKLWKSALILTAALAAGAHAQQSADEAQDKKLFEAAGKGSKSALQQLRTRAEQGDVFAQCQMGLIYEIGNIVAKDYVEAVRWFRRAAEQGNASSPASSFSVALAQGELGMLYAGGEGVPKDLVAAYMWLNLSAANGNRASAIFRERVEQSMTSDQIAEAQRLSREWKPTR